MTQDKTDFDLVVVGGGPAGSTLATFVAMQGHKVLLLEKEGFPRHQIGESLLPATIHGICPLLGVSDEIRAAKFVRKAGGTFRWGKSDVPWTFNFASSPRMASSTGFAYQVERAKFDAILLNNARRKGVEVRERAEVSELIVEEERVAGIRYTEEAGKTHAVRSKYVADTSGNTSRLYKRTAQRVYSKFFENVALFGYYRNGKRLPAPNQGNILSAAFDGGWFWYIPLSDELTSVGAVISRQRAEHLKEGRDEAMKALIAACPLIRDYLDGAERITEGPYGKLRLRMDYSYCCTRFWSPGMMLVGDAACFVDPVFSSGVHLATYSALLAARSVNSCLRRGIGERQAFDEFELRYRREYGNFYRFLVAFYDMNQDEESYFWSARKVLQSQDRGNEAFVRLVAGVGNSRDSALQDPTDFFENLRCIGASFQAAVGVSGEFDHAKLNAEFMAGFTKEINHIQLHAMTRGRLPEAPLWPEGLAPTADGLHWRAVNAEAVA